MGNLFLLVFHQVELGVEMSLADNVVFLADKLSILADKMLNLADKSHPAQKKGMSISDMPFLVIQFHNPSGNWNSK